MKRAWTHLTALVALVVAASVAAGQVKPADAVPPVADPLRPVLEKKGCVAVPLIQEEGGWFAVACKSGTETWWMRLDTGAENSSLDLALVKKLGLKHGDEVTTFGIEGSGKAVKVSLRGLSIGDFDTRAMANEFPFQAFDFTAGDTKREGRNLRRIDGLLGHSALWHASAVIDYSTRTLYLRTPLDGLWPEIEGKWVATAGQEDGQERKLDPKAPPRLEFKDRRFHLSDGTDRYSFGLHVRKLPGEDHYTQYFFAPEQESNKELKYRAGGLLKVSGDKLTVCLVLDPAKAKEMPDGFTARSGSGHLLLEFRREKPRTDRPAGPADPLRAVLEKKGYVAVPLTHEEEGCWFTVECKSGTETLRLVLDTGAEISALDINMVKKLGLTPKGKVTAVGTRGTRDGFAVSLRELSIGNFDTRATANSLPAAAFDFSALNAPLAGRKLRPIDGLLGHTTLDFYAAVIDYSTRTLYLRAPLAGLLPEVKGR